MPRRRSPKITPVKPIKKSPIRPIEERYPPSPIDLAEIIRKSIEDAMEGRGYIPTERQRELIEQAPDSDDRWYLKETKKKAAGQN